MTTTENKIKVGDKVAYSKKFLQSIADYSFDSASKRGKVTKIIELSENFHLAEINGDFGIRVNIKNIIKESEIPFEV